jgi:hypothetical protein
MARIKPKVQFDAIPPGPRQSRRCLLPRAQIILPAAEENHVSGFAGLIVIGPLRQGRLLNASVGARQTKARPDERCRDIVSPAQALKRLQEAPAPASSNTREGEVETPARWSVLNRTRRCAQNMSPSGSMKRRTSLVLAAVEMNACDWGTLDAYLKQTEPPASR